MDTFLCSSWYQMRYPDPRNAEAPVSRELAETWLPVDQYTGGSEHATMHLLYARFFYKVARDLGVVPGDEPFTRYFSQGQILGPDGRRMSKSRGNVIAPDEQVQQWGADTFRAYLMFLGPWEQGGPYDTDGIVGIARWLNRVWNLVVEPPRAVRLPGAGEQLRRTTHRTLKRVTDDIEAKHFNTMLAALMEFTNFLQRVRESGEADEEAWREAIETLLLMIAPSCPHIAEELWERQGGPYSIHQQAWPEYDPALVVQDQVTIPVQVNGKVRERIEVPADADEAAARAIAEAQERIAEQLAGHDITRVVFVPGRLLNYVLK
jgi:leucyl-tRNA synthetase